MPKVTDEYREAKRLEITHAAMRAFHRRGFQGTSMADIIAESGLSAGAIYGHFRGKSEIVLAVAQEVVGARIGEVGELLRQRPMPAPATVIRILMDGMFRDVGSPQMLVQLWGEAVTEPAVLELARGVLERLRSVYAGYIAAWQQQEHGLSEKEAAAIAASQVTLFVAAAQGFILQAALVADFDREAFLTTLEKYLPR